MRYNTFKYSKKNILTKKNRDIYNIQIDNLTYKGLSNTTIQLDEVITNVPEESYFVFDYRGGILPEIEAVYSINNDTSKILDFSDSSLTINSQYIYHIIQFSYNDDDIGVVKYSINNNKLTNPTIVNKGYLRSFFGNVKAEENLSYDYLLSNNNKTFADYINFATLNPGLDTLQNAEIGTDVIDARVSFSGSGYKLGSSFYIDHMYNMSDYISNKCTLSCKLSLSNNTVSIFGGSGYTQYETFTVSSDGTDAEITIMSVDDNGTILSTGISNYGDGFITTPTVTYNGNNGNGATIDIINDYSISYNLYDGNFPAYHYVNEISQGNDFSIYENDPDYPVIPKLNNPYDIINTPGEGYLDGQYQIKAKDSLNVDYTPSAYADVYITTEDLDPTSGIIITNNTFDITSLIVKEPGNNVSIDNINLHLFYRDKDYNLVEIDLSDYITVSNNFIDIDPPLPGEKFTEQFQNILTITTEDEV